MSIEAELRAEFDRWERWENRVFQVLPYAMLGVSTVITLMQPIWGVSVNLPVVLGLTLAATLWLAWFHTGHPQWHDNTPLMAVYYSVLLAMGLGLVAFAPWYGLFTFVGYPQAFQYLKGRWRYAGVTATAFVASMSYLGGARQVDQEEGWLTWLGLGVLVTMLSTAFSYLAEMEIGRAHV